MWYWLFTLLFLSAVTVLWIKLVRRRNVDIIARGALTRRREPYEGTRHIFFCVVDHFEPLWQGADRATAVERVKMWSRYPKIVDSFRDNSGRPPQHNFFYAQEEYLPECVDPLTALVRDGFGSVEIHLHHDKDTSQGFRDKIEDFKRILHRDHGLLQANPATGTIEYAFIHGNWALDDSGAKGKWCGVRDEIRILKETGCYADFTYPSAPHPTQPPIVNRIYYATDDPLKPRSHHRGVDAAFGKTPGGDLLFVNGPLAINWRQRRKGIFPAVENGGLARRSPPTPDRVDLWIRTGVAVRGWANWVFVKVYTHGAQEGCAHMLLGDGFKMLFDYLLSGYNDGERNVVHFVTPQEVYRSIKALESGDRHWIQQIEAFDYASDVRS
jgi:hypothetical protein